MKSGEERLKAVLGERDYATVISLRPLPPPPPQEVPPVIAPAAPVVRANIIDLTADGDEDEGNDEVDLTSDDNNDGNYGANNIRAEEGVRPNSSALSQPLRVASCSISNIPNPTPKRSHASAVGEGDGENIAPEDQQRNKRPRPDSESSGPA